MIRRWIRHHLPKPDHFDRYFFTRPFKKYLSHPSIWALNRRSVAGGVAAGLFCGLIPGPFQVLGAFFWSVRAKVNLPVAFLVTFYTNPFTIVPLYLFAVAFGQFLLGKTGQSTLPSMPEWDWTSMWESTLALGAWSTHLGPSLAVGLPACMVTFSSLGYLLVRLFWNIWVRLAVIHRRKMK